MISIVKMNRMGIDSSTLKFLFEFEFDNGSTLPEKAFAVGSKTYLIADGSTAQNIITSTRYEYNKGKWTKLTTTSEDTTNTDKITDNGNYSFANNDSAGFNDVTVDVAGESPVLIEKSITANGDYSASDDNADGYSSVNTNIVSFNQIDTFVPSYNSSTSKYELNYVRLLYSSTGEYVITGDSADKDWVLTTPVKSLYLKNLSNFAITFTPDTGFDTSGVPYKFWNGGTGSYDEGVAPFIGETIVAGTRIPYCGSLKHIDNEYKIELTKWTGYQPVSKWPSNPVT